MPGARCGTTSKPPTQTCISSSSIKQNKAQPPLPEAQVGVLPDTPSQPTRTPGHAPPLSCLPSGKTRLPGFCPNFEEVGQLWAVMIFDLTS
ncbi:hypothetical protein Micbo1qcDRAFT_9222 [Microdochium bolleyi]|uniref:Uncharacterized protein n=1 Tax=Microdochium bolleyi TaxID=196109 RepID=A0A136JKI1_9PEZI|nr:hypothetical protein Micbo1qcDRAFT_9222 [Microdochium bolleyi]